MKVRQALAEAERTLAAIPGHPRLDAEILMADALGVTQSEMALRHLDDEAPPAFAFAIQRRMAREPIAYITGRAGFWTIELEVGPGALIPRADSETLIEAAVDHFKGRGPETVLDLGTGPGTLLLAALHHWPRARGIGVDSQERALSYARANAARLGMADRADLRLGDWARGITGPFDLILSNPPYIPQQAELDCDVSEWEPWQALFAGTDGLDAYRVIAPQLPPLLAPGGVACIEIGADQLLGAANIFAAEGFTISSRTDLRGKDRCLVLRR